MKFFLSFLLLATTAVAAFSNPLPQNQEQQADEFARENNSKRAQNPEGVLFTLGTKNNQRQFYQGELIILELSFSGPTPNAFLLDTAGYDRSGRLHMDEYVLDRKDGVADPLYDYFYSGLFGFAGGGLRGLGKLTEKPYPIFAELNEWVRFDKPGRYRLYVISPRVGSKKKLFDRFGSPGSPVVSNVVEFEILPLDPKWANQKLNEAITALAKPDIDHRAPCRILRFLGTTAAVREMRKRFGGDDLSCDFQYQFGLIGSPHRDFVIRDMESALSSPDQPVTSSYLRTLALLEFIRRTPPPPSAPPPQANEEQLKQYQTQMLRRRDSYNKLRLDYLRQLATAIPQKQKQARATSLQTLLDHQQELNADDFSQWSTLLASMPDVFSLLPLDAQNRLLSHQWKPVASAAMLPILRGILKAPDERDSYQQRELRSIALRRLFELAPDEGRRLLIDEIRRPNPRVNQNALQSLPDETLPELDNVLATNLEESRGNGSGDTDAISELIERYATASILPRVRAVYEAPGVGHWACRPQTALLAYLLRVDPAFGGEQLSKALAARGKDLSRCWASALGSVARLHTSTEVEEVAIASIEDEDPEVVSQAADVLERYGSADAEKALWRQMERWHEAMQSRSEEMTKQDSALPAFGAGELGRQAMIEQALRNALSRGQGWLSDPEKLKRLRELCLTDQCRRDVDQAVRNWNQAIYIAWYSSDDAPSLITIAQYQPQSLDLLKQKLLQFPKGTTFNFRTGSGPNDEAKAMKLFDEIKSYLEEHGMKLERATER